MKSHSTEAILQIAFDQVLRIADPKFALPKILQDVFPIPLQGRCLVIGGGKASAAMADAFERYAQENWPQAEVFGHIVTRYDHDVPEPKPNRKITVTQAAHPVPDEAGKAASEHMLNLIRELQPGDHCIALVSGGGSSLLALPPQGIQLESLRLLSQELLRSGAPIEEMNVVRKHVSAIQGGRMAQVAIEQGVAIYAFIISDVTGDEPSDIASGPCAPDPSTFADALGIFEKYHLHEQPQLIEIFNYLKKGVRAEVPETLKSSDLQAGQIQNHVFATAQKGLDAAAQFCREQGYEVISLGDRITGEAKDFARYQKQLMVEKLKISSGKKFAWISGGETTVTIPKGIKGRGGRCSEFLLALMHATQDMHGVSALAADTDGIDGTEHNAGAFFTPALLQRSKDANLDMEHYLDLHDAYGFFEKLGSLVVTGPTLTNVNDFRIVLINPNDETHTYSS
jgi:glycerate 2-kinase